MMILLSFVTMDDFWQRLQTHLRCFETVLLGTISSLPSLVCSMPVALMLLFLFSHICLCPFLHKAQAEGQVLTFICHDIHQPMKLGASLSLVAPL